MAFIDEAEIKASAGRGGDGVVRWLHEKGREYGGPSGGDGGKGGGVYATAVRDIGALARFRQVKEFKAQNGGGGKSNNMHGANGKDYTIELPVGSIIINRDTDERFELLKEGERVLLLIGGAGGFGNSHFKNSVRQRPKESTKGAIGESASFFIELQLIADVGLIGLPNAGKSSILNELTRAHARVGSYAFTTLEPNLGVMHNFVLADIPGLIEGAAEGKGLGHKFLRHVKRTKILLHCVSLEEKDLEKAYRSVRGELGKYSAELLQKPEVIVLTKSDLVEDRTQKDALVWAKKHSMIVSLVSILDSPSIKRLSDAVPSMLSKGKEPVKS